MRRPLVSVVMAVRNDERFLPEAIESILSQTVKDFEFIIIDDGSSDGSWRVVRKYARKDKRIISKRQKNQGLAKSLNNGIALARGTFIARMDSDDISLSDRFEEQLAYLAEHKEVGIVGCQAQEIDERGNPIPPATLLDLSAMPVSPGEARKSALKSNPVVHPTMMIRKDLVDALGGYDERFAAAQDYDFVLRALGRCEVANLATIHLRYRRVHGKGISFKSMKVQERYSLKARWNALKRGDFPPYQVWRLLRPAITYLIPASIKMALLRRIR